MDQNLLWSVVMIGIGVILLGLLVFFIATKKYRQKTNYKAFFIMGVIWLPIGLAIKNYALVVMGLVFMTIGLLNKSKWEDDPKWSELSDEQKRIKLALVIILGLLVLAGLVLYLYQTGYLSL